MSSRFFDVMEENTMTEQDTQPKTETAVNGSVSAPQSSNSGVKNTTLDRGEKTPEAKEVNMNRNPEGVNQHTPSDKWYGASYRDTKVAMKAYLDFNPDEHMDFIINLVRDAKKGDPTARKLVVQLTGGFDPTETKVSGEVTQIMENPLNKLSIEELRTLKALKKEVEDGK